MFTRFTGSKFARGAIREPIAPGDAALPLARADRRSFLAAALATGAAAQLPRLAHAEQRIVMNDASRLNPTPVAKHLRVDSSARDGLVERLRAELKAAAASGRARLTTCTTS